MQSDFQKIKKKDILPALSERTQETRRIIECFVQTHTLQTAAYILYSKLFLETGVTHHRHMRDAVPCSDESDARLLFLHRKIKWNTTNFEMHMPSTKRRLMRKLQSG